MSEVRRIERKDEGVFASKRRSFKKSSKAVKQREVVHYLMGRYGGGQRRAARFWRSSVRYESRIIR